MKKTSYNLGFLVVAVMSAFFTVVPTLILLAGFGGVTLLSILWFLWGAMWTVIWGAFAVTLNRS